MSKDTPIEWCDSSANPVMGCDGCELWIPGKVEHCYAGSLHKIRAGRPGYADTFEVPKLFPGRMAIAANWNATPDRTAKPWLTGPRKIFISDMGDALSRDVPLEYLRDEVIGAVNSENGRRHHWLWLTKQPQRMVRLAEMIGTWPDHLWAMTSVTSAEQTGRVRQLLRVPAKVRGISYEPALGPVDFASSGAFGCSCADPDRCSGTCPFYRNAADKTRRIDWVIIGGESGPGARPFDLAWARSVVGQCKDAGVAVFVKQMGALCKAGEFATFQTWVNKAQSWIGGTKAKCFDTKMRPMRIGGDMAMAEREGTFPVSFYLPQTDRKGGDWSEWPADLQIREFPQ